MKIKINSQDFDVPAEEETLLLRYIQGLLLNEYEKLDQKWRLLLKPVAREGLRKMEADARKAHGNEKALALRPAKRQDPVIHLSGVLAAILQEALKHVSIELDTADHTIAAFKVAIEGQGESRRQMATYGNERVRQDNGA